MALLISNSARLNGR